MIFFLGKLDNITKYYFSVICGLRFCDRFIAFICVLIMS